jgi:competence protein ComEC
MIARLPFVGFVVFLAIGIVLGNAIWHLFQISLTTILTSGVMLCAIGNLFYFYNKHTLVAITFAIFLVVSGTFSCMFKNQLLQNELSQLSVIPYSSYEAFVKTIPEKRKKSLRVEISVKSLKSDAGWTSVNSTALINIPLNAPVIPEPGDHIIVRGRLWQPQAPLNPEEFDYQKYLWSKGIVWTGYLPVGSYQVLKRDGNAWNPSFWSIYVSQWADKQFRENIQDDQSYGLVKAMLLGRRDDLRTDQVDDYTTSGTVHILSVSGMHVALIFLVISILFGWMKRLPGGKYIYMGTVTSLLVFYSIVTGFPPSVQRATLMCIVLVIAEVFQRKHNSVNSLGVSAFLILLLDPLALYDVGFQLSYMAMLGIFLFYKPMESMWTPSNWLFQKTWQITALSFAAQLATFPLSIYYFHQFPFYFWLVNPFIIAFTNLLLPGAMLLLFVSIFPLGPIQWLVNSIVQLLAYLTNVSASVPKRLPGFLIDNLYLDRIEVVLLYVLLLFVFHAFDSRQVTYLKMVCVTIFLFVTYSVSTSTQTYFTSAGMFHAVPRHSVISFKEGSRLYISSDPEFALDTNAYNFYIRNYAIKEGILEKIYLNNSAPLNFPSLNSRKAGAGTLIRFGKTTIFRGPYVASIPVVDYHLLVDVKYPKNSEIDIKGNPVFLLGGGIKQKTGERWKRVIQESGNAFHDLRLAGALSLN